MTKHTGSCHCQAVRYEVEVDLGAKATRCNCTICTKLGTTGSIVKPSQFKLLSGESMLTMYARNPEISARYFCSRCGVQCFSKGHLPELGGDFVGIAVNGLDDVDLGQFTIGYWDGRHNNWHAGMRSTPWPTA